MPGSQLIAGGKAAVAMVLGSIIIGSHWLDGAGEAAYNASRISITYLAELAFLTPSNSKLRCMIMSYMHAVIRYRCSAVLEWDQD